MLVVSFVILNVWRRRRTAKNTLKIDEGDEVEEEEDDAPEEEFNYDEDEFEDYDDDDFEVENFFFALFDI